MSQRPLVVAIAALLSAPLPSLALNVTETEGNDTRASAQSLNGNFSSESVANIFNSTSVPHVSVSGTNNSTTDVDYYSFNVPSGGVSATFDVDGAEGPGGCAQQPRQLHTVLALFDAAGNLLAADVTSPTDTGSVQASCGTPADSDSFIGTYTFANPGTYFIGVTNGNWFDQNLAQHLSATGTSAGAMTRPDAMEGGLRFAGDSGPVTLTSNSAYDSGVYTLHVSLQGGQVPASVPIPIPAFGVIALGLLGLGWRRLSRRT